MKLTFKQKLHTKPNNLTPIKYTTFRKKVNSKEIQKELKYDYFLHMKDDWRTKYYSGVWNDLPSMFLIHLDQIFLFQ